MVMVIALITDITLQVKWDLSSKSHNRTLCNFGRVIALRVIVACVSRFVLAT